MAGNVIVQAQRSDKMRLRVAIGITWGVAIGLVILNLYEIQRTCQTDQDSSDTNSLPVEFIARSAPCPKCPANITTVDSPPQQMEIPQVDATTVRVEEEVVEEEVEEQEEVKEEESYRVPNVVHYVWYATNSKQFEFHQMLSVFSAFKMLQPEIIYFHTNMQPYGEYWERVLKLPTLNIVHRNPPLELYGEKIKNPVFYTSHSNVDRLKILSEYGGIYLDLDVLVTRSFDDLRKFDCVVGLELPDRVCNSVIVCTKDSPYLTLWLNSFLDDYQVEEWSYNSGTVPYRLARRYPQLVHVEAETLNRPNFRELHKIWGPVIYDWKSNYAIHLWFRIWKTMSPYYKGVDPDDDNIMATENTFSRLARFILHSDSSIFGDQISETVSDDPTNAMVGQELSDAKDLVDEDLEKNMETDSPPQEEVLSDDSPQPNEVVSDAPDAQLVDPGETLVEAMDEVNEDVPEHPARSIDDEGDEAVGEEDEERVENRVTESPLDRESYLKKLQLENHLLQNQGDLVEQQKDAEQQKQQLLLHQETIRVLQNTMKQQQQIVDGQQPIVQQQQYITQQPQLYQKQGQPIQQQQVQPIQQQLQPIQQQLQPIQQQLQPIQQQLQPIQQQLQPIQQQLQPIQQQLQPIQQQLQPIKQQQVQPIQQQQFSQQQQNIIDINSQLKRRLDDIPSISHKHQFGANFKLWPGIVPSLDIPEKINIRPIQPQPVDLQNIKVATLTEAPDLDQADKSEDYTPLNPSHNPFRDSSLPRKVYVKPENTNTKIKSVDAIPDKAWQLDNGPQFQGLVNHIQADKTRQELNEVYENSKRFGAQPLTGQSVAPPVVVAEDSNDLGLNIDLDMHPEGVKDELIRFDNQDEFPDDDKIHGEENEELVDEQDELVDDLDEQMKREAIGGIDTAGEEG